MVEENFDPHDVRDFGQEVLLHALTVPKHFLDGFECEGKIFNSDVIIGPESIIELRIGVDDGFGQSLAGGGDFVTFAQPDLVYLSGYELRSIFFEGHIAEGAEW